MDDAEVKALLDDTTPGPWKLRKAYLDDDAVEIVPRKVRGKASPEGGSWAELATVQIEYTDSTPKANARLIAAAPDLARTLLDVRAENTRLRADAQAAVALALEEAAKMIEGTAYTSNGDKRSLEPVGPGLAGMDMHHATIAAAIRALAPADGLAAVEALRKEQTSSPNPYDDCAHFDDHAVNRFAVAMKGKLAAKRLQGRGGWQEPDVENGYLSRLLREHVDKGDPVDVANLAMMIHQRGERIGPENEGATCGAIERAEAERDRLRADAQAANGVWQANLRLQAELARVKDALHTALLENVDNVARLTAELAAAQQREAEAATIAKRLAYWLDTDAEVLADMDARDMSDHQHITEQVRRICAALSHNGRGE